VVAQGNWLGGNCWCAIARPSRPFFAANYPTSHAADALYSNFALRILEVDNVLKRVNQRVNPEKGRFRDYLKVVLRHMVIDHYRQQQRDNKKRQELIPGSDNEPIAASGDVSHEDERFLQCWRQELVNQAWNALLAVERDKRQPYGTLLRLQEQNPTLRAAQLAEKLTQITGKAQTPENVRQLIHRGRKLFGKLLVEEVARSLGQTDAGPVEPEKVEQELIDLGLLFCRPPSWSKSSKRASASIQTTSIFAKWAKNSSSTWMVRSTALP
jgi:hypothetical protein